MNNRTRVNVMLAVLFFYFFAPQIFAQGDLLIFPKRLVFEGTQNRVQTLTLNNSGKDTATYRISYVENKMNEDGKFELIETPEMGQQFASPYLRFFPRTITLAPRESQVVKVQLSKTNELESGEYRSHLYFRAVKEQKARGEEEKDAQKQEKLSVKINLVHGISIANIIRIGEPEVKVELSNLAFEKFNDHIPIISMDFFRNGKASSYGDISVIHISPKGEQTTVGQMKGFAVYTPGNLRKARMKLQNLEDVDYNTGKLKVIYTAQNNEKSKYAEAILTL